MSAQPAAEQPCVICGTQTTDRHGTVAWMKEMPRCADREACKARKEVRQRAREQRRDCTERDIERGRQLAEEMDW